MSEQPQQPERPEQQPAEGSTGAQSPAGDQSAQAYQSPSQQPGDQQAEYQRQVQEYQAYQQQLHAYQQQQQAYQQQQQQQQQAYQQQAYQQTGHQTGQQYAQQYGQQHYGYTQPGGYTTYPLEPSNDAAIGSLVTSLSSLGFLLFTGGILAPITLIASICGIFIGRKGIKNVDEGRSRKSRDLAQAGFIMGIVGAVSSVLAIAAWIAIIVFAATAEEVSGGQLDSLIL